MRTALPSSGGYPAVQRRRGREAPIYRACRRFCRNKLAVAGLVIVLLVIVAAVLAPYISPHDPLHQDLMEEDAGLSWQHWLGADQLGRDILSRLIYGARVALVVGGLAVSASVVVGLFIGIPSAYLGGWLDDVVMRIMDVLLAFPYLLLAIAIVAALGPGLYNTIIAIAVWLIPTYARLSRSVVLSTKQSLYVEAARAIGIQRAGHYVASSSSKLPDSHTRASHIGFWTSDPYGSRLELFGVRHTATRAVMG